MSSTAWQTASGKATADIGVRGECCRLILLVAEQTFYASPYLIQIVYPMVVDVPVTPYP
jgi:hypothetical protein